MKKIRVLVAMSGGVDSSVCVAILKKNGYDVVAVFMRMHNKSNPADAKTVAKKLKIPFKVLDVRNEFKKIVVDYLIKEYKKGNTPNPCVECNRHIKFKFLLEKALQLKFDYVATGHYVRIKNGKLFVAKDTKKDQTYFLWQLNKEQLAKVIFPLGDYTKEQVRSLAKKFKLPVFEKKDSQEICFVSDINEFLQKSIKTKKGNILNMDGKKIGEHKGLVFYTIGQRKGIEIGGTGPYYVVRKDFKKNALIVSNNQKDLLQKDFAVKNVNWLNKPKKFPFRCGAKIRSMSQIALCVVSRTKNSELKTKFLTAQRAITPGQSAVFYKGNELLGGGIIEK